MSVAYCVSKQNIWTKFRETPPVMWEIWSGHTNVTKRKSDERIKSIHISRLYYENGETTTHTISQLEAELTHVYDLKNTGLHYFPSCV